MSDEFLSPNWARNHGSMSTSIHKLVEAIDAGFRRLVSIQFAAPWRTERRR